MNRSTIVKGLIGLTAATAALAAGAAQAQSYGGYNNGAYYDPCARDKTSRSVVGGLLGAGIGAALGNNIAAGGHRGDGSVLGGVVGGVAGAAIGNNSAACSSGSQPYAPAYSNNNYSSGYYDAPAPQPYYAPQPQAYYAPPPPPVVYAAPVYAAPVYVVPRYGRGYGRGYDRGYYDRGSSLSFQYYGR
jgi:hypothetical protein